MLYIRPFVLAPPVRWKITFGWSQSLQLRDDCKVEPSGMVIIHWTKQPAATGTKVTCFCWQSHRDVTPKNCSFVWGGVGSVHFLDLLVVSPVLNNCGSKKLQLSRTEHATQSNFSPVSPRPGHPCLPHPLIIFLIVCCIVCCMLSFLPYGLPHIFRDNSWTFSGRGYLGQEGVSLNLQSRNKSANNKKTSEMWEKLYTLKLGQWFPQTATSCPQNHFLSKGPIPNHPQWLAPGSACDASPWTLEMMRLLLRPIEVRMSSA